MEKEISPRIYYSVFCRALLLAVVVLFGSPFGLAQTSKTDAPAAASMRALNNSLLNLHGQMQQADVNHARVLRGQAATVIAQRAAALTYLIQNNPHDALAFAFSPELLADLATKFPQSSSQLESHATVSGPVQHWIADYANRSRSWWSMNANGGSLYLYFANKEPAKSGEQVLQATGVVVGNFMAVETSAPVPPGARSSVSHSSHLLAATTRPLAHFWPTSLLVLACAFGWPVLSEGVRLSRARLLSFLKQFAIYGLVFALCVFTSTSGYAQSSCMTTGVQNVIVILATFPGVAPPSNITPQSVHDMFFGASPSVNSFWQETSYGTTSATGDVFGWLTLTGTYSGTACQSLAAVQSDAMSAAAASGANFQNYNRVVVIFPDVLGCGWSGLSSIGCSSLSTPSGTINASSSYLSAAYASVQVATHELGHGLGLSHASSRGFADSGGNPIPLGPLASSGTLTEYGDKFSAMSCCTGNLGGEYAAPHKAEILGWLPPNAGYQTVQASGSYTLQPYEILGGLKAIKVQRGTGNDAWLWIEYRQPDGSYDTPQSSGGAFPSPVNTLLVPQPYSGALIHYEDSATGLHSQLINYTPSDSSFFSPALLAGQSWSDPYTNLSLSVLSATSSGLTVAVNYGPTPCTAAAPSVTVSPLNPSIYPGQSAGYAVSVTNNDSSGCSSSTIDLGSTAPSGWFTSLSAPSVTLSPGQSASVTMDKGAPAGTLAGTYAVNLNAATTASSASGTANATVMTPPSLAVSVSISGASFTRPGTVSITAAVTNGGTSSSGANVTFSLTAPNGASTTQTATTSSNGTAIWNYKLNAKSLTGTYSVVAQAALSSGTKKNATTTQTATSTPLAFTVQ